MSPPFVRSPYNYDLEAASDAAAYVETMESLTVQSMADDADLNVLMKRFGVTGHMPVDARMPMYGDFTHISDYRSAIAAARAAEESFMQFPAHIRAAFANNPQHFIDYIENPANIAQVREWFPNEERLRERDQQAAGGGAPPQSSSSGSSGGAGAAAGDRGASVSQRPDESGRA